DAEKLTCARVVLPGPQIDQPSVRVCILGIVAERCLGGAGMAGRLAISPVSVGARDFAFSASQQSCTVGLVVVQVGDGTSGVADLLHRKVACTIQVAIGAIVEEHRQARGNVPRQVVGGL